MIASWMCYAALVAALLAVAAAAVDHVAAARGWPRRFIWMGAMLASTSWPALTAARGIAGRDIGSDTVLPFTVVVQPMRVAPGIGADPGATLTLDRLLIVLWAGLSLLALARIVRAVHAMRRARAAWTPHHVDGTDVRLSRDVGPAVVGLRTMDVVLPDWILALDQSLRAVVLCHEQQHREARDPYLLHASALFVALMPWNPALWYAARRLRLAIELDCDARVLRVHPSPETYGMLMLAIAQRRTAAAPLFAAMLSEPASQLERRIIAMQSSKTRMFRSSMLGASLLAAAAIAVACTLRSDTPTAPEPSAPKAVIATPNQTYFEFQVTRPATPVTGNPAPRYPTVLREADVSGEVLAQFVVGPDGRVDMNTFKVLKSSHDLFTQSVRNAIPNMRFAPGEIAGTPVKQLVQMPFQFQLSKTSAAPRPYHEFTLGKRALPLPTNTAPRYPDELRASGVQGNVVAQFVVNADGTTDTSSFKVLRSDDVRFTRAVRNALGTMKFSPAETNDGHRVRQLVTMPFEFSLSK